MEKGLPLKMKTMDELIKKLPLQNTKNVNMVREGWDRLHVIPGGKQAFSYAVGKYAPYTGNIGAIVEDLGMGHSKVRMKEKRWLRNHLKSIHAVALVNLAELAGNIALSYSMPDDARFIVTEINIKYLKKARGSIYATCQCPIPESNNREEFEVPVEIYNTKNELLCKATLTSLVGPKSTS
jgi:uncharacterized protein (TIGR00369 family)